MKLPINITNDVAMQALITDIFETPKDKTIIYVSHKENTKKLFEKIYDLERRRYV